LAKKVKDFFKKKASPPAILAGDASQLTQ
jgi:hypothetical protein